MKKSKLLMKIILLVVILNAVVLPTFAAEEDFPIVLSVIQTSK